MIFSFSLKFIHTLIILTDFCMPFALPLLVQSVMLVPHTAELQLTSANTSLLTLTFWTVVSSSIGATVVNTDFGIYGRKKNIVEFFSIKVRA